MNYELGYYEEKIKKETGLFVDGYYIWKKTVNPVVQIQIEKKYEGPYLIRKGLALFPETNNPYTVSKEALVKEELKTLERKKLNQPNIISFYFKEIEGFVSMPREILGKVPLEKLKKEIENLLKTLKEEEKLWIK